MNSCAQPVERFHSLDALRASALLLGVFFHAAESFVAGHEGWPVVDCHPSELLMLFRHICHSFRMEVFFLLCGFFARLVYHRKGWREFTWNRFQRIFIPFAVGWFIMYPLLVLIWMTGVAKTGRWEITGIPPEARHLPPWKLTIGFFTHGMMFKRFDLTHLWFLHQLLVIYLIALPGRWLLRRVGGEKVGDQLEARFQRAVASPWRLLGLAVPTVACLLVMDGWDVDTPKSSLWPHLPTTLLYGWLFTCGWFLHRQPSLLQCFVPRWWVGLLLGLALALPTGLWPRWALQHGAPWQGLSPEKLLQTIMYALMMWSFISAALGWFVHRMNRPSAFWRYVADSSYWVYLAHLPTVVVLQILIVHVDWPWPFKYALIMLIALPLLFASYHVLVRSTFLGQQLNGRKVPFRLPWKPAVSEGASSAS